MSEGIKKLEMYHAIGQRESRRFGNVPACGFLFVYHFMVPRNSNNRDFCFGLNKLHVAKISRCSSVRITASSPSAKNCDRVIPNALHIASKVGIVGALFLLNIFDTVEWERPDSMASR